MSSPHIARLTLLGSPHLTAGDGPLAGRQATQRHRIALLALLASARSQGLSRDKVIGYLWPESDTPRARNALNVSVYVLRKALGEAALQTDGDELRLNTGLVRTDISEFEAALAAGEHERAVGLYRGPFLDGFFLSDAPEFEQWVERERKRLADAFAAALEKLAKAAAQQGDLARATAWWKARAGHDPYDSRVALELMRVLDAAGNPAGALHHAAQHERLLREEFGLELPADIAGAEAGIRARVADRGAKHAFGTDSSVRGSDDAPPTAGAAPGSVLAGAAPADPGAAPSPRAIGRAGIRFGLAVVMLVAIVFVVGRLNRERAANAAPATLTSIAVLPFASHSSSPDDGLLADGMTEALTTMLARTPEVRVVARTSAFAFRERQTDVRQIADSLGASHVVEGALQRRGTRLLVQVRLVAGSDGSTEWSESYDRQLEDVFAVQEEIARSVTRALGLTVAGAATPAARAMGTRNVAAYEFYLRGSDEVLLRSDSSARVALEHFRRAVSLDSNYAAAYAGMARMQTRLSIGAARHDTTTGARDGAAMPQQEALRQAEQLALRAIALDAELADGHAVLGLTRWHGFDYAAAETHLAHALQLEPDRALHRQWLAGIYLWTGRPQDALAEAERAVNFDPLSASANAELARALAALGRCDETLARLAELRALHPPLQRVAPLRAQCYAQKRMWREAAATMREVGDSGPYTQAILGYVLARAGDRPEAMRIRDALIASQQRRGFGAHSVGVVYAGLGDLDQAFAWFDRAIDDGSLIPSFIPFNIMSPVFHELHSDPRFEQLRGRMGFQKRNRNPT